MKVKMRYLGLIFLFQIFPIEVFGSIDPNLVGWWKFDENQGIVVIDYSGRERNGTFHGGSPRWQPGLLGGCLGFDGIDDCVELPIGSLVASLTQATISFWINVLPPPAFQDFPRPVFIFTDNGITRYLYFIPPHEAPKELTITDSGGENAQTVLLPPGNPEGWTHFAITLDGTTAQVFYNGQLYRWNQVSLTPQSLGVTINNWLGKPRPKVPDDRFFTGLLDDFRIYNRALSIEEVGYLAGKRNSYVHEVRLLWEEICPVGVDPDINLDGIVDIKDVFELLDHWLEVQIWP
jgi:arabinan endo-1,5-alpha-L-arabinosidase